jgi:acetyl esterase
MHDASGFSPALFDPAAIDPETVAFNKRLEAMLAKMPLPYTLSPRVIREAREEGRGIFGPLVRSELATERVVPGPAGEVPLRVFVPETVRGVYLYIHGGGHTLGRAHHQDPLLERTAREAQVAVVSVEYRLAPEHPFPAGPDDCEAAALWLVKHARAEFGSDRLLIGGASAGAHLAVLTLLRLRDRHGVTAFSGANLEYGVYDLSLTPSARRWGERYLVLSTPTIEWFTNNFVSADRRRDPEVSPLYADLAGLPPALFTVGTLDPLLDDSLFMAARWLSAGNAAELLIYPGGVHAFNFFRLPLGERANARSIGFIAERARA